jgi:putative ABC transport system permease protein
MGPALPSLLSHWRRNPVQLAMLWLGLALATALWSGVQAINAEARSSYDEAAATLGAGPAGAAGRARWRAGGDRGLRGAPACGLRVSPVITGELRDESGRLRLIGIDPSPRRRRPGAPTLGGGVDAAAFLGEPGLLLMSEATASGALPATCPPVAILDTVPPPPRSPTSPRPRGFWDRTDPDYLIVAPDQPADLPPLPGDRSLRLEPPDAAGDVARLTDSFHLNLTAFGSCPSASGFSSCTPPSASRSNSAAPCSARSAPSACRCGP